MKRMIKLLMILLSYAPIATVAVAAQAKASEIEGEAQNVLLLKLARDTRYRLLPDGHTTIHFEDAKKRYSQVTGLQGMELEKGLTKDLQFMLDQGLVQLNEKGMISSGPSQFAL